MFDLCLLFTRQWPGRDDAEVLVNKVLSVQTETFGSCRAAMIKKAAHAGVLDIVGDFQHKLHNQNL